MSDLSESNMHALNFADDTLLYNTFSNSNEIKNNANKGLGNVMHRLKVNHLKLNSSKTKYMIFAPNSPRYNTIDIKLKIDDNL